MPTPARTSIPEIVAVGRLLLEEGGLDALTMQAVAARVGVRAPSLYKRVRDRADLIRLVVDDLWQEFAVVMSAAAATGDPATDLRSLAHAFRAFALERPNGFGLLFARLPRESAPDPEAYARASRPLLLAVEPLAGRDDALHAARTFTAWASGFVRMELAQAFNLGGDVDAAFAYGVEHLIAAITTAETDLTRTANISA